jgi:integrase
MNPSKNPNHPKKGSRITVEPIRSLKDVKAISKILSDSPRDLLLFTIGINNGLRVGDLLQLKVKDLVSLKAGDRLTIRESKTNKDNVLVVNKAVHKALRKFFGQNRQDPEDYLFGSNKVKGRPLKIESVNRLVKEWCRAINLKSNYGAHTLRKTFGYIQRTVYGVGFEVLAKRFNHSSPAVTMRYLGIEDKEVHDILMNEIG